MNADSLFKKFMAAEKSLSKGDWRKAAKLCSTVIDNADLIGLAGEELAACYLNRGFALRKIGRQHESLQDYEKASQLNPRNFKPHLNAALIYAQDFNMYYQALEEFNKAIALNPTCVEAFSSRGLTKLLSGDIDGAEADLMTALSLDHNNPNALCNLGNLYLQRRDPKKAAEIYKQALGVNPSDYEIRVNLAIALTQMGSEGDAESVLREDSKAIQLWEAKSSAPVRKRIGLKYFLRHFLPKYKKLPHDHKIKQKIPITSIKPVKSEYLLLAQQSLDSNDIKNAHRYLGLAKQEICDDNERAVGFRIESDILRKENNLRGSIAALESAVKSDPNQPTYWNTLSARRLLLINESVLLPSEKQFMLSQSEKESLKAISLNDYARPHQNLALIYLERGILDRAKEQAVLAYEMAEKQINRMADTIICKGCQAYGKDGLIIRTQCQECLRKASETLRDLELFSDSYVVD
ncbi:tetratricopeptide repeat protein [Candidatus Micrarchaeota archaeon]|nr:tetratricopeptide repeat protein [Candidatus Micrarchaeota archaeon]